MKEIITEKEKMIAETEAHSEFLDTPKVTIGLADLIDGQIPKGQATKIIEIVQGTVQESIEAVQETVQEIVELTPALKEVLEPARDVSLAVSKGSVDQMSLSVLRNDEGGFMVSGYINVISSEDDDVEINLVDLACQNIQMATMILFDETASSPVSLHSLPIDAGEIIITIPETGEDKSVSFIIFAGKGQVLDM